MSGQEEIVRTELELRVYWEPTSENLRVISNLLDEIGRTPEWVANPRLYCIFARLERLDLLSRFLEAEFTDWWLPIPKRTIKKFMSEAECKKFWDIQNSCLDDESVARPIDGNHYSVYEGESMNLEEIETLGAGGYGEVHLVRDNQTARTYARKTMIRPLVHKRHRELLKNFKREISGMRRVANQHCVELVASYTDSDSVCLVCLPVADMDLSRFLNLDLDTSQMLILRRAVGCITSALTYLHDQDIRHDDLKPGNILIHGDNVLLSDFGFCLDFSDSGMSTTTGPPLHFTQRYSAPEVFDRKPRSRLTDVWGLGCVLFEIVSRLLGRRLDTMKTFWCANGKRYDSYAENRDATMNWYTMLTRIDNIAQNGSRQKDLFLLSFVYNALLEPSRLHRPSASQVLDRLKDMDLIYPAGPNGAWLAPCCIGQTPYTPYNPGVLSGSWIDTDSSTINNNLPRWPMLDLGYLDSNLAYLFLDSNLDLIANSENLSFLEALGIQPWARLNWLFSANVYNIRNDFLTLSYALGLVPKTNQQQEDSGEREMILKALYLCRLKDTGFAMHSMDVCWTSEPVARKFTVQLSLVQDCLERQSHHGRPYMVIVFDPNERKTEEGSKEENDVHSDKNKSPYEQSADIARTFAKVLGTQKKRGSVQEAEQQREARRRWPRSFIQDEPRVPTEQLISGRYENF